MNFLIIFPLLKNRKKVFTSSHAPAQSCAGECKNAVEVITDSGDEFEHLTVEVEDRYISNLFLLP